MIVVLGVSRTAFALKPGEMTPLGILSQDNSSDGTPQGPTIPLNGYYFIWTPFPPNQVMMFRPVSAAPSGAKDKTMTGTAATVWLGWKPGLPGTWSSGTFGKVKGLTPGWVRIEVVNWQGVVIDKAHYAFYEIVTIEDDVGASYTPPPGQGSTKSYVGYDPRYGSGGMGWITEQGGPYFRDNTVEPASESIKGFDDRYQYGGTSRWDGFTRTPPRIERWMPEAELQPGMRDNLFLNSLVASTRDNQYVRVWMHGPRENKTLFGSSSPNWNILVWLQCNSIGSGEVHPGKPPPPNPPEYRIKVDGLMPPKISPPSSAPGLGYWCWPMGYPGLGYVLDLKRGSFDDGPEGGDPPVGLRDRKWIVRIPWKGMVDPITFQRRVSSQYADIEVEAQIPNPQAVAQVYGADPKGQEGCMQFRWGTVVEMKQIDVRLSEPTSILDLKDHWFRRVGYELHDHDVTTPDRVSIGFGSFVTGGLSGREYSEDLMKVKPTCDAEVDEEFRTFYKERYFEEVMANAVNRIVDTDPQGDLPYSHWTVAEWPFDTEEPWYDVSGYRAPESVALEYRGYVGIVERGPGRQDFQLEPAEHAPLASRTLEVHFINAVGDVNNDGIIDRDDDQNSLEQGEEGGPGMLVNCDPNAHVAQLPQKDENLRKILVRLSTPQEDYGGTKIQIESTSPLTGFFLWEDDQRGVPVEKDEESGVWVLDPPQDGEVDLYLGANRDAVQFAVLRFFLVEEQETGEEESEWVRTALDELKVTTTSFGIDVDSENDHDIDLADDLEEEVEAGLIVLLPEEGDPPEYELVIRQHDKWSNIEEPSAKLLKEGLGKINVADDEGDDFLEPNDDSAVFPASDVSGSSDVTYTITGDDIGPIILKAQVQSDGKIIAFDWLRVYVLTFEADLDVDTNRQNGVQDDEDDSGEEADVVFTASTGALLFANQNDDDGDGDCDGEDSVVNGSSDLADIEKVLIQPICEDIDDLPNTVSVELTIKNPPDQADTAPDAEARVRIFSEHSSEAVEVAGPTEGTTLVFKENPGAGEMDIADLCGTEALELGIEGLHFGRQVILELSVRDEDDTISTDEVRLLVCPYMVSANTQDATIVYIDGDGEFAGFFTEVYGNLDGRPEDPDPEDEPKIVPVENAGWQYNQDKAQSGYTCSRPGSAGEKRVVVWAMHSGYFRGLQDADTCEYISSTGAEGGNVEASPPTTSDPYGRVVVGSTMAAAFREFIDAQKVQGDSTGSPIVLPVDWLDVGHADEVVCFVPTSSGYKVLVPSLTLAISILRENPDEQIGTGGVEVQDYLDVYDDPENETALGQVTSDLAQVRSTLKGKLGLSEGDIIDVPVLFSLVYGQCEAYLPNMVNMIAIQVSSSRRLEIPDPLFAPFQTDLKGKLTSAGYSTSHLDYVDTLDIRGEGGEAHCASLTLRKVP